MSQTLVIPRRCPRCRGWIVPSQRPRPLRTPRRIQPRWDRFSATRAAGGLQIGSSGIVIASGGPAITASDSTLCCCAKPGCACSTLPSTLYLTLSLTLTTSSCESDFRDEMVGSIDGVYAMTKPGTGCTYACNTSAFQEVVSGSSGCGDSTTWDCLGLLILTFTYSSPHLTATLTYVNPSTSFTANGYSTSYTYNSGHMYYSYGLLPANWSSTSAVGAEDLCTAGGSFSASFPIGTSCPSHNICVTNVAWSISR